MGGDREFGRIHFFFPSLSIDKVITNIMFYKVFASSRFLICFDEKCRSQPGILKTQGFIRFLHLRAIYVQLFFSSWRLKKLEQPKVLQCFSLDLVVRKVCCSMVVHTRVVSKQ